jgi:hypothetical protein
VLLLKSGSHWTWPCSVEGGLCWCWDSTKPRYLNLGMWTIATPTWGGRGWGKNRLSRSQILWGTVEGYLLVQNSYLVAE